MFRCWLLFFFFEQVETQAKEDTRRIVYVHKYRSKAKPEEKEPRPILMY